MNKEWKETLEAVIDTNMDMIERLDNYEEQRNDPKTITAVQNLEKINRTLYQHLEAEQPLTPAELNLLAVYTSAARGSYTQKVTLCNKMVNLCYEIEDKLLACKDSANPSEAFYSEFSKEIDLSIN